MRIYTVSVASLNVKAITVWWLTSTKQKSNKEYYVSTFSKSPASVSSGTTGTSGCPGVNFTNILRAAFAPIFLRQKSTNFKSQYKKASRKTFVRKTRA